MIIFMLKLNHLISQQAWLLQHPFYYKYPSILRHLLHSQTKTRFCVSTVQQDHHTNNISIIHKHLSKLNVPSNTTNPKEIAGLIKAAIHHHCPLKNPLINKHSNMEYLPTFTIISLNTWVKRWIPVAKKEPRRLAERKNLMERRWELGCKP